MNHKGVQNNRAFYSNIVNEVYLHQCHSLEPLLLCKQMPGINVNASFRRSSSFGPPFLSLSMQNFWSDFVGFWFWSFPFLSRCDQMVQHVISSGAQIVFVAVFEVLVKRWNKNRWVWRHWRPSYHCQQNRAGLHLWRGYLHWRYCLVLAVPLWGTNNPRRLCDDISHCLISPTKLGSWLFFTVDGRSSRWGKILS